MKTRFIAGVLIAAMTTQNVALAAGTAVGETDRTKGIGETQISEAEAKIIDLRISLDQLDGALMGTETEIKEKRSEGEGKRILAVTAAGLGLGLSAAAYLAFGRVKDIPGNKMGITVIMSTLSSIASATMGFMARDSKATKVDSKTLIDGIDKATDAAKALNLNGSPTKLEKRDKLVASLKSMKASIATINEKTDAKLFSDMANQTMQMTGALVTLLVPTEKTPALAILIYNAGNLVTVLEAGTSDSTDKLLEQITLTREQIKAASLNLMAQKM
jgi:hypothetical protein